MAELDGIEESNGVVMLGATNKLEMVDPAILRAGRFDYLLEVPLPSERCRHAIFEIHTKGKPLDQTVDLRKLSKLTEGCTGADIELICKKAALAAVREHLNKISTKGDNSIKINSEHFEESLNKKDS